MISQARCANWQLLRLLSCWSFRALVVGHWFKRLSGCNFLFVEIGEGAAFRGQLFQQRGGFPEFAVGALKFADAVVDFLQSTVSAYHMGPPR